MQQSQNAFTLIELVIVVVLLAIIAAYGIPTFTKSRQRVSERDGGNNLETIASAMEMYRMRNEGYPDPPGVLNLAGINTTLYLGIIAQDMTYACADDNDITTFSCTAAEGGWTLRITQADNGVVCCVNPPGLCPTILDC